MDTNRSEFLKGTTWMGAVVAAVISQCLCAADITWRGVSGVWGVAGNWSGYEVPTESDSVLFPAGLSYEVEVAPNHYKVGSIEVAPGSAADKVTFTGNKNITLYSQGYAFTVGKSRHTVFDGGDFFVGQSGYAHLEIAPNARLDIVKGKTTLRYGDITVNTNAVLNVCGGTLFFNEPSQYLRLAKDSRVNFLGGSNIIGRIVNNISTNKNSGATVSEFDGIGSKVVFKGGYVEFPDEYALSTYVDPSKTEFEFLGGVLSCTKQIKHAFRTLLPPKGGTLINSYANVAISDSGSTNHVWQLGGIVSLTGLNACVDLGFGLNVRLQGGGVINTEILRLGSDECHVDLSRINIASNIYTYSHRGHTYFDDGITFGASGNVDVFPHKSARLVPCGTVKFDTVDAIDGETVHSFDLSSRFDLSRMTSFVVEGEGTVGIDPEVAFSYLHNFSVDAGATVSLTNYQSGIVVFVFHLGAGATLSVGSNGVDVASVAEIGDGARIRYSFDSLQSGTMYPLWSGPHGSEPPVSHFEFEPALPGGWAVATSGSVAYLWDGNTVDEDTEERGKWLGVKGGKWNDADNWSPYDNKNYNIPGGYTDMMARFGGNRQLAVTNDLPNDISWMRNLNTYPGAGPYVISGNAISVTYPLKSTENSSSVANNKLCSFPFVIESEMAKHRIDNPDPSFFKVQANGKAPVVLAGGGMFPNDVFVFRGDVRVGGNWQTLGLYPTSKTDDARDDRLVLLPGAYLETIDQVSNQTVSASYQISADSGMTINGRVWRWIRTENTHFVDGVVTSICPVQATAQQTFIGEGVMSLAMVQSDSDGAGKLKFAENITVRPAGWKTVRAGADNPITMVVRGNATIGAWGDWVYGAEDGFVSETAAADRALKVVGGAKTYVSFDTEGNTVTLKDPLVIEKWSTVLKKGEGALVLKSDENDLADSEFELLGGELRLGTQQAFGKLTFAGGSIAVADGFNADAYTPIFTAKKIVGEVAISGRYSVKTIADDNGVTVSIRRKRGAAVILR